MIYPFLYGSVVIMQLPEQYIKAGEITREVRKWLLDYVKPGLKYSELCQEIERKIIEFGAKPAFPCGIGVNHVTAHYSPGEEDNSELKEEEVVKIDFGAHIDGYIADTAVTITFNEKYYALLEATEKALEESIKVVKKDLRIGEIGRAINNVANSYGFKVIQNLSGHTLDRYTVHAGKSIPNLYVPNLPSIRKDEVFAIEPFLTLKDGAGYVVEQDRVTIFALIGRKITKNEELDELINTIWNDRKTLPFSPRWYEGRYPNIWQALKELQKMKIVRTYPALIEVTKKPVAQFEHTLSFENKELIILT